MIVINSQDIATALLEKYNPVKWGGKTYYYLASSLNKTESLSWAKKARELGCLARVVTVNNKEFGREFMVFVRRKQ